MNKKVLIEEKALKRSMVGAFVLAVWGIAMAVEIIKTGRRLWLTVKFDPRDDEIKVDDFMKVKATLSKAAREVYENTETEVLLERN